MAQEVDVRDMEYGPKTLGYTIRNNEKWTRAVYGAPGPNGTLINGVGEEATDLEKLAAYDRLAGLILKDGNRVKTGSFWDFKKNKPHAKPQVVFVFRDLTGEVVEIPEGEEIPVEVKAAEMAAKNRSERAVKAAARKASSVDSKKEAKKAAKKAADPLADDEELEDAVKDVGGEDEE